MDLSTLIQQIRIKKSMLCVGLDTDITKIPKHLLEADDAVFEFNKQIIDATHDLAIAFKPNTAFYECLGTKGWQSLEKTIRYIKNYYPEIFCIADAKRGDIGNTSTMYAKTFFEGMQFDAVTVAPYMGADSVKPFLAYKEKFTILLALTSNEGAKDFQYMPAEKNSDKPLFEKVIETAIQWGTPDNLMFVAGATKATELEKIRNIIPQHFLLVPGIGAQGGDLHQTMQCGKNSNFGLIINASRSIIYAASDASFAEKAREQAIMLQKEMSKYIA